MNRGQTKKQLDEDISQFKITRKSGESVSRVLRVMHKTSDDPKIIEKIQKNWDSPSVPEWNWKNLEEGSAQELRLKPIIEVTEAKKAGYTVEYGSNKNAALSPDYEIEETKEELPWYNKFS